MCLGGSHAIAPMIRVKRVYDPPSGDDGFRLLVDRLWPRGLSKEDAKVDLWLRDISPSSDLRKWYSHDPAKWHAFQKRYVRELSSKEELLDQVRRIEHEKGTVTLLFSSKERMCNNAVALQGVVRNRKWGTRASSRD